MDRAQKYLLPTVLLSLGMLVTPTVAFAATIYANYSSGDDTTGDGSSGTPYKTFHKAYTEASDDDVIDLTGTFDWSNGDETGDSSTSGYTLGKDLIIRGQSATSTIVQAASSAESAGRRVFTVSSSASTTLENLTVRYGSGTSGAGIFVYNDATTTLRNMDISYNVTNTTGDGGGVYVDNSWVTIENSAIHNNAAGLEGGGVYVGASNKETYITNSTVYYNYDVWCCNALEGGGVHIQNGTTTITNSAIIKNGKKSDGTGREVYYGAGIYLNSSSDVHLYLKNSIVAENIGDDGKENIYKGGSATIYNGGYNIVGRSSSFTATTGDWVDSTDSGTFTLNTVGTTGSLNLASHAAVNDADTGTATFSLESGSVAIDNANGTANNGVAIPTLDQRGATRSGATDIGPFEYNGGGLTIVEPSTQASSLSFSSVAHDSIVLSFTPGDGSRRIAFMKAAGSGNPVPVDGTAYSASSVFGDGDQIGSSGWYAIYNGNATSSSVTISGLTRSTEYIVQVMEYNGLGSSDANYLTATAASNPNTQTTHTPTIIYSNYSTGDDSTGDGSSGSPYKTFHKAYTEALDLDTIDLSGTFDWSNADETGDSSGSGYTNTKEITIRGQSATTTIIQAASSAGSAGKRVFSLAANASTTIQDLTLRYGYLTSGSGGCVYVYSNATTTLTNVMVHDCISDDTGDGGGIAIIDAAATITNSAIFDNGGGLEGGGVYFDATNKDLVITNTTIYQNYNTWCCNALEGGGLHIQNGTTTLTNSTLVRNGKKSDDTGREIYYGGGIYIRSSSDANLYIKNSIVAESIGENGNENIWKGSSGVIVNGGYNIVGRSSNYTATTGDWVDSTDSGTFTLNTVGTTGSLNLAAAAAENNSLYGPSTWAILDSSIGIDAGDGTANNGIAIPTLDQRGGSRSGATDIGAYEYGGGGLDAIAPSVLYFAPADDATGVGVDATFEVAFNEAVSTSTGNIVLYKTSDDSTVETIDVTSSKITASSTTAFVINPATTLDSETGYYFLIDATAIDDTAGNSFAGIAASTTWSFTTVDAVNPLVSTLSPADNATDVAIDSNLVIVFDESVATSTGNITLYKTSDDSTVEAFDVASSALLTGSGTTYTINPTSDLDNSTEYYVWIDATAFDDLSSNSFAGITASTTWSFTSVAAPVVASSGSSLAVTNAAPFTGSVSMLPGYIKPREQIVYPDGRIVYLDEQSEDDVVPSKPEVVSTSQTLEGDQKTVESVGHTPSVVGNPFSLSFDSNLRAHARGPAVRVLQQFLNSRGFLLAATGPGSPGEETDYFGPLTFNALVKFQEKYADQILKPVGLTSGSGVFAESTRAFIKSLSATN